MHFSSQTTSGSFPMSSGVVKSNSFHSVFVTYAFSFLEADQHCFFSCNGKPTFKNLSFSL